MKSFTFSLILGFFVLSIAGLLFAEGKPSVFDIVDDKGVLISPYMINANYELSKDARIIVLKKGECKTDPSSSEFGIKDFISILINRGNDFDIHYFYNKVVQFVHAPSEPKENITQIDQLVLYVDHDKKVVRVLFITEQDTLANMTIPLDFNILQETILYSMVKTHEFLSGTDQGNNDDDVRTPGMKRQEEK